LDKRQAGLQLGVNSMTLYPSCLMSMVQAGGKGIWYLTNIMALKQNEHD